MKITPRVAYILNMAAKPGGSFIRVSGWDVHFWHFIRPYEYQRPAVENLPSAREVDKLLAAQLVRIVERPELGFSISHGKKYPERCAIITDIGRQALLKSGLAEAWV